MSILSTRRGGGTTTMSGTSMAAPYVGGADALFLSGNTGASPAAAESALEADAKPTNTISKDAHEIRLLHAGGY